MTKKVVVFTKKVSILFSLYEFIPDIITSRKNIEFYYNPIE